MDMTGMNLHSERQDERLNIPNHAEFLARPVTLRDQNFSTQRYFKLIPRRRFDSVPA